MGTLKKANAKFKKKAEDGEEMPRKFTAGYEEAPNAMRNSGERKYARSQYESEKPKLKVSEKKAESFGEAFKRNKASGAKTFTWNNKSYTTETKADVAKKATSAAPAKATPAPAKKAEPAKPAPRSTVPDKLTTGPKTPSTGTYTPPGKPAGKPAKPLGNRPPSKAAAQKFGGKTKKKCC